ncbi:MAG TPA: hypothetical protein VIU11_26045 [Nakamurella sp.]
MMSALDILDAAGLLIDDRPDTITSYFARKTAGLPEAMTSQLTVWLDVMLNGSQQAPRRRSRDPQTARLHLLAIATIAHAWAAAGHRSFAEITTKHIRAALPERGPGRTVAETGLRSLFSVLKARKLIFTDPARGLRLTPVNHTVPLPLNTAAIRAALDSPDPAVALGVALVCFHALTSQQIVGLTLTDIVDGKLNLAGRSIPIAEPVRVRLTAYLDHRQRTWPASINPHLFISRRSAPRLRPVGRQFLWQYIDIKPQALREDRILQEIHATGGDVRRICDLFGINIQTAERYASTLANTTDSPRPPVPRTRNRT